MLKTANSNQSPHNLLRTAFFLLLITGALPVLSTRAGDWPQILGPTRNGVAANERPIAPWPKEGPKRIWSVEVGSGYAGPAVVGSRVVLFHRVKANERVSCFDAATGKTLWETDFPATYRASINPDDGPRCVPLIHDGRVYLFGAAGMLHSVNLADGKKIWSRDAYSDFDGQEGYFGAGSTPIVADNKLIVNVGGRRAGIVAFDLANGKTLWQTTDERASYSSPTSAVINGQPHVIFVTRLQCVAVNPRDGKIAFAFPFGKSGPTVNAATPLVFDSLLFVSSSYNVGARLVKLAAPPEEIWGNDETMSSQYTTSVYRDKHLYGIDGREDYMTGQLRCVEASTGKIKWNVPGFGTGHLILIGNQLLILTTEGELVLASAQPDKYFELARATIAQSTTRALPAFSNGRFYFRDNSERDGRLGCLGVGTNDE